uniref:FHA domain-containing protein n=1 Tax=Macrostomum lignano TaxID=282301 RepID=A0A1I8FGA8_9PLAT
PNSLQVLKSGVEVQNLDLQGRSCLTIGRQSDCDLRLEHTVIVQYSGAADSASESEQADSTRYPSGWYLIDLGSTHGTLVNKVKLPPQQYRRLRVGHVIRLAGSTRLLVLQGPESDQEAERRIEQQIKQNAELQSPSERDGNSGGGGGCTWGFAEDAVDEAEESAEQQLSGKDGCSAAAQTAHSRRPNSADPLKSSRWYDRRHSRRGPSQASSRSSQTSEQRRSETKSTYAPVDSSAADLNCPSTPRRSPETAEAPMPPGTRKRDAIAACALAACQLLDRMGELDADAGSGSAGSSRERRLRQLAENDFYEEDEDAYLDRTGQLEAKRRARMAAAAAAAEGASKAPSGSTAVTFDQLTARCQALDSEIADLETQLEAAAAESASRKKSQQQQQHQANSTSNQLDELEEYMRTIKSGGWISELELRCD